MVVVGANIFLANGRSKLETDNIYSNTIVYTVRKVLADFTVCD